MYKKDHPMDKANYRPINVLPTLSKILEGIFADEMNIISLIIRAKFRPPHSHPKPRANFLKK